MITVQKHSSDISVKLKKTKRHVLLSLCGYEALRWPLWAIRGKAFFWACMGLTVQLGRKQSMQATWGTR